MAVTCHHQPPPGLMWGLSMVTTPFLLPSPKPHHGGAEIQIGFLHQLPNDSETLKERGGHMEMWRAILGPALA